MHTTLAAYTGHSQFFNKRATLKNWEWPGYEANTTPRRSTTISLAETRSLLKGEVHKLCQSVLLYKLLSLTVGVRNVKAITESVLRNIACRQADRLHKQTALCDTMLECLTLA